ncbi:MAG: SPOR domain-containing protein [Parvibaculaceae bacterium]
MDQDTSNSPGKARWRERLGMGNPGKDLPKISDEFKPAAQASRPASPAPAREARLPPGPARGHQPVTKPAPMAPRTPPRPAQQSGSARPVSPIPQGASGLGDRLRAERQAAEKLAGQRVAQARGSAPDRPLQPPPARSGNQKPAPPPPDRPKFSFSPEELAKDKREQAPPPEREFPSFSGKSGLGASPPPPLTPPRPALGGNAASQVQPSPRQQTAKPSANNAPGPAAAGFQPRFSGPPSGGNYRSLDPPPGGFGAKPKPYADTAAFREDPLARRPASREYDSYRRGPALPPQPAYGDEADGPSLGDYRRRPPVPARARRPAYDEDVNEVFEDEEPPRPQRRRASAQDYSRAYRDYDDGYEAEAPRRRGPWPWLAAFAAIALVAAGIIYYYLTYMKSPGPADGNVPVIEAPDQSPKTAPENTSGSTLGTQGSAQPNAAEQRKQIYDRILGDEEVDGGRVVPTQEQPQPVAPTGDGNGQGAAPLPEPSGDNANEPLPLPLPPPGDQGALPGNARQQTAALGAVDKPGAPGLVAEPVSTNGADGGPVPGQLARASERIAAQPPPQNDQMESDPEPLPVQAEKPAKPKPRVEKKATRKVVAAEDDLGAGQNDGVAPLVLVPPAQTGTTQAQNIVNAQAEPDVYQPQAETAAVEEKSRSFFSFGGSGKRKLTGKAAEREMAQSATGNWINSPNPNNTEPAAAEDTSQQVASMTPEPLPAPEPVQPAPQQANLGGGYIAQLASFRSEAEAMAEYDRLRAKHGTVLSGLSPRVVRATVAGTARYRLAVGPLASRSAASKVCNSLIAAGERDCLVRGN